MGWMNRYVLYEMMKQSIDTGYTHVSWLYCTWMVWYIVDL